MGVINNSADIKGKVDGGGIVGDGVGASNVQGKVGGGGIVGGGVGASSVIRGKSAYEVALAEGFVGTEQEWLDSLKGEEGVSVTRAEINKEGELILYFSDESHINVGRVVGEVIEGISPEISVEPIVGGNRVTIKDVGGTKYVDIFNGTPGNDGYSPTVAVSKSGKVTTITIIDKNGKKTVTVNDGADGDDGFSPVVSVSKIDGGHRVSVTNKNGSESFDVMDGKDFEGCGTYFAICSTDGATAEKSVSVEGFTLKVGAVVTVKFNTTNTVTSPTLNVSDTGAYPIIYKGAVISAYPAFGVGSLEASKVYDFVFTGANYELVGGLHIDRAAGDKLGYAKSGGDITFSGGVGTVNRADKAVADEDGKNIKENYAKKTDIPAVPVKSVNGKTGAVALDADDVGARPNTWTPSYSDVGADKSGTAASAVSSHNVSDAAHNDIRLLISGLVTRLDALANSDDTTLDQMAEVVKYIKDNRDLISQITTDKVNVSDIVNNVTTNVSNRPLSAAQGVALKALIDAITVPTKLSDLSEDASHRLVTDTEKAAWNAKSNFSGAYSDLSGKPTIPTVPTKVSAFENDKQYITSTELGSAVNEALEDAKESGDFKGEKGDDGKSYLSEFITVKDYGAKGDGSTDDTAAINAALTEAGNAGVQVYFPAGTYKVTSSLKVPNGILLRGDCGKSVIKTYVTSGYVLQAPSSTTLASNSIVDLTFQNGNSQDSTTKLQSGDFIAVAQGLYMSNCRVKNYYRVFTSFSHNSYIYNNRFTAIYKHFASSSTDSVVDGNYINASRYGFPHKSEVYASQFNSTSFRNNLVDYFYDVFGITLSASGTISSNTFNRCVNIFHDHMAHLTICNNLFTGINADAVDLSVLTTEQQNSLKAEKWCVIRFDDTSYSTANHIMAVVTFADNMGYGVDNYIYVADGTQLVVAECDFRGNMINTASYNKPSAVDVGFRNATSTETNYNSFQNVYFDFLDMKEWSSLPSASLIGNTAKSVKSFPYMKAIYNDEIYINIKGTWRMYAPPIYDGGIA